MCILLRNPKTCLGAYISLMYWKAETILTVRHQWFPTVLTEYMSYITCMYNPAAGFNNYCSSLVFMAYIHNTYVLLVTRIRPLSVIRRSAYIVPYMASQCNLTCIHGNNKNEGWSLALHITTEYVYNNTKSKFLRILATAHVYKTRIPLVNFGWQFSQGEERKRDLNLANCGPSSESN